MRPTDRLAHWPHELSMVLLSPVLMVEGRLDSFVSFHIARFLFYESLSQQCITPSDIVHRDVKPPKISSLDILRQGADQGLTRVIGFARIEEIVYRETRDFVLVPVVT